MIGVSHTQLQRDTGTNVPHIENNTIDNEVVINNTGTNVPPTGAELVQKIANNTDKAKCN